MPIPVVSVVIPTFNRAENLVRALISVLSQTVIEIEVIVVDDGSTDQTREALSDFHDPRLIVEYLPENSQSPAIPRNVGIWKARGKWVAFLDSDDWWEPEHLASGLATIEKSGQRAACGNAFMFPAGISESHPAEIDKTVLETMHNFMPAQLELESLLKNNLVITSSVIMRREDVIRVEGFPSPVHGPVFEDYAVWLRVATFSNFAVSDKVTVHYQSNSLDSHGAGKDFATAMSNTFLELQHWLHKGMPTSD